MAGALLAGASDKDVDQLEIIAKNVGYAFQIRDDILDVTSSLEVLGKPIGSDAQNDKATYVTYAGLDESQKAVERFTNEALSAFNEFDNKNVFLGELFIYLINREN